MIVGGIAMDKDFQTIREQNFLQNEIQGEKNAK